MRAITTDIKILVARLGPVAVKALERAVGLTVAAGGREVTPDHLLRALLDTPDSDVLAAMTAAGIARPEVAARLDWHLKRLPGGHQGRPSFSAPLCLLLQDAAALTTDRVRTGHLAAALLADPSLSGAGIAAQLGALPRDPLHLMASRLEDPGDAGQLTATTKPAEPAPAPKASPAPAPQPKAAEPKAAAGATASSPRAAPSNAAALRARFADRLVASDEGGLTLSARVGGHDTSLRLAWDTEARILVLRIALPGDGPKDEVGAAVALSTLNNALPHGAFVLDQGRIAFRSHVFLDADRNAPVETVAFAVRVCEQAAATLADDGESGAAD
jgi:hypothetical protein